MYILVNVTATYEKVLIKINEVASAYVFFQGFPYVSCDEELATISALALSSDKCMHDSA